MGRYWVKPLVELPRVPNESELDPDWYPIQHFFGLSAFGANAFRAGRAGIELIADHDESRSGHEELYFVASGAASFTLDGETFDVRAGSVVALPDPRTRRSAVATAAETTVLAMSAKPGAFASTWDERHFEGVPRARPG